MRNVSKRSRRRGDTVQADGIIPHKGTPQQTGTNRQKRHKNATSVTQTSSCRAIHVSSWLNIHRPVLHHHCPSFQHTAVSCPVADIQSRSQGHASSHSNSHSRIQLNHITDSASPCDNLALSISPAELGAPWLIALHSTPPCVPNRQSHHSRARTHHRPRVPLTTHVYHCHRGTDEGRHNVS